MNPEEYSFLVPKCHSLIVVMENWLSIYRKRVKVTRWQKDLVQLTQLFQGNEIKALDASKYVKYCKDTIKNVKCGDKSPSFKEYIAVRDYLLNVFMFGQCL